MMEQATARRPVKRPRREPRLVILPPSPDAPSADVDRLLRLLSGLLHATDEKHRRTASPDGARYVHTEGKQTRFLAQLSTLASPAPDRWTTTPSSIRSPS